MAVGHSDCTLTKHWLWNDPGLVLGHDLHLAGTPRGASFDLTASGVNSSSDMTKRYTVSIPEIMCQII